MKVIILCGGVGSRMKEETEFRPKPMVKIGEQPILWHIMKHYAYYGFNDFLLALGYRGEMIREYFFTYQLRTHDVTIEIGEKSEVKIHKTDWEPDNWTVTLVDTGLHALKGARMKRLERFIPPEDELFMMTYGDGVCDLNLVDHLEFHRNHGKLVTVTGVIPSMRFGEIRSRSDGSVEFRERDASVAAMVNGGYYVINRTVLDCLEDDDNQDFEAGPLEDLSDQGDVRMNRHEGFWHCMDNLRDVEALNKMWAANNAPWKIW
jgi:glucose-1-phosphate cytidylyltransferase